MLENSAERRSVERSVALNLRKNTHFSTEKGMRITNSTDLFVHKRIASGDKKVKSVSDRMS
jgi:hypothetical protein